MERVIIFDTTLRDGEQSPGASMNTAEKIRLAWQLEKLGQLKQSMSTTSALHALLEEFIEHSEANVPVAEWPL